MYLGPSRTFDDDDLQYLNGDIPEEEEEVKPDSYRSVYGTSTSLRGAEPEPAGDSGSGFSL